MGENIQAVQLKQNKLKEELSKVKPDQDIINRLRKSIKRHKKINKKIRHQRFKSYKNIK